MNMPAKKKAPAKKAPAKKAPAKAVIKVAAPAKKLPAVKDAMTKTQILNELAESTSLSKKECQSVLDGLGDLMERHVKKRAVGHFTIPGLTKAKKNVPNPFKPGELMDVAAKPARNVVKVRPLKKLKDMVV
jgi:nucleoid DNA-binding protein